MPSLRRLATRTGVPMPSDAQVRDTVADALIGSSAEWRR
jgi:hypothetical protein